MISISSPDVRRHPFPGLRLFLLFVLWAFTTAGMAQFAQKLPGAFEERGFSASGTFQESVNVMSGSVNIAIPLASLSSSNSFTFQLTLFYDSNVWTVGPGEPFSRTSDLRMRPSDTFNGIDPTAGAFAWNVSPGWLVHPGRIIEADPSIQDGAHFLYLAPDHSTIPLYQTLRGGEPVLTNTYFSRDNRFLKFVSDGGPTGTLHEPNGVRTRFVDGWFFDVADPHGNTVVKTMIFPQDPLQEVIMVFRENRFNREIRVGLTPTHSDIFCATPCFNPDMGLVEWVEYPVPGVDAQGNPNVARIEFGRMPVERLLNEPTACDTNHPDFDAAACQEWHDLSNNVLLQQDFCDWGNPAFDQDQCSRFQLDNNVTRWNWHRHLAELPPSPGCPGAHDCIGDFDDLTMLAGGPLNTYKPPLNRLTFPDGSEYRFNYGFMSEVDGGPPGMLSGAISEMILPSGATFTYTYGAFRLPDNRRPDLRYGDQFDARDFWAPQMGVISKKYFEPGKDFAVDTPDEEIRYRRGYVDDNNMEDQNYLNQDLVVHAGEASRRRDVFAVVTSPLGNETVHFFRTPERAWDYGLPFTRQNSLHNAFPSRGAGDIRQAYLSQEVFAGPAVVNGAKGNLQLQRFIAFDRDIKHGSEDFPSQLNARLHYTREVFHDDPDVNGQPHYKEQLLSNYDGYGNYRTATTRGTYGNFQGRAQTVNTNPETGTYVVFEGPAGGDSSETFQAGTGHNFTPRASTAPWMLANYDYVSKLENGQESRDEYVFDQNTGKLLRKRILANFYNDALTAEQNRSAKDVIYVQAHDSRGTLTATLQYGGDVQNNLATGALATLDLPANPEYRTGHVPNYTTGEYKSYVQDPATGTNLLLLQTTKLDDRTGLIRWEEAADGVRTTTGYNPMLLEISKTIGDDDPIRFDYQVNTDDHGTVVERSQGPTKTWQYLDGLGRSTRFEELFPGNTRATSVLEYVDGATVKQSNPHFTAAARTDTINSVFDFKGRPTQVTYADGTAQTLEFRGDRLVRKTNHVANAANGTEAPSTRTETYDPLGRLFKVSQTAGGGHNLVTQYGYNVHGMITEVRVSDGTTTQVRSFNYDNRGFLIAESHPEMVVNGSQTEITYSDFDTAGKVGEMVTPEATLRYSYHFTGQLSRIAEVLAGGGERTLKDFYYSTENLSPSNRTAGKMVHARRFNYLPGDTEPIVVTKTYFYEEANGRLSKTRLRTNTGQHFEQDFTYDGQGNIDIWGYPAKTIDGIEQSLLSELFGGEAQRTVNYNYTNGMLTSITGMVTNIEYHPHQAFYAEITHNNGLKDVVDISNAMVRPHRIKTQAGTSNVWNSGIYTYDGSGNVKTIGGSTFRFDLASRLVEADILSGGNRFNQTFAYDDFGNMTDFDGQAMNVDPQTNRFQTSAGYDGSGNITQIGTTTYTYDALGVVTRFRDGPVTERYLYDVDDRRLAVLSQSGFERWTLRDEEGVVVKEYHRNNPDDVLKKVREYIYGARLMGAYYSEPASGGGLTTEKRHYHLDHLGNIRMITDPSGAVVTRHDYYAYGQEISPNQGDLKAEILKFTGQERDAQDRDYFKARYYQPMEGRFLSPDPVNGDPAQPHSWNRYAYGNNNPLVYTDPNGETNCVSLFCLFWELAFPIHDEIEVTGEPIEPGEASFDNVKVNPAILLEDQLKMRAFDPKRDKILSRAEAERLAFQQITGFGVDPARDFAIGLGTLGHVHPFMAPNTFGPHVRYDLAPAFQAGQLYSFFAFGFITRAGVRGMASAPGPGGTISGRDLRTSPVIAREQAIVRDQRVRTNRPALIYKPPAPPPAKTGLGGRIKNFYRKHESTIKAVGRFAVGYFLGRFLGRRLF